jgi:hypothetical protein
METLDMDKILTDLPTWWEKNLPEELSNWEMEPYLIIQTISEGRLGARHPINKPNTTPRRKKVSPDVSSQGQAIHTLTRNQVQVKEEKSDWYLHLTGLIGWWRRVEAEQTKFEEKQRKIRKERKHSSVAKLSFVINFLIRQNRHEKSKQTLHRQPSIDRKKCKNYIVKVVLSPSTKRKGGEEVGVLAISEFSSPEKRQRNFQYTLSFWEEKSKITQLNYLESERDISAETTDDFVINLEGNNGFGSSLDMI